MLTYLRLALMNLKVSSPKRCKLLKTPGVLPLPLVQFPSADVRLSLGGIRAHSNFDNHIGELNEWADKLIGREVVYEFEVKDGGQSFECEVKVRGIDSEVASGKGKGRSKKEAKHNAALDTVRSLKTVAE